MIAQDNYDRFPRHRQTASKSAPRLLAALLLALLGASIVRPAPAAPTLHNVAAANINVVQNDSSNNAVSVTVTLPLSINDLRIRPGSSRGDFNLQVGANPSDDVANGVLMASIAQNGRNNGEPSALTYTAGAIDAVSGGTVTNGYWVVVQDGTSNRAEYNANCAAAYFPYSSWIAGWAFNTDGTGMVPSEVAQLDERPRLRVFWVPAGTASASFRQGVNGYGGAFDTRIREPEPDAEASTLTGILWTVEAPIRPIKTTC